MNKQEETLEIEVYKIGFLVSLIHNLNLSKETTKELLETYYSTLEQGKLNGFSDTKIIIKNKPNLLEFLKSYNIIEKTCEKDKCKIKIGKK